ncbi:MAG: hypothetical protein VX481_05230 [Cyanobacteriota bacterium]|nr:hypothetical protein [Cyanobacteriota bacterium]
MGASLNLIHATRHRWRYRIVCGDNMDWRRLSSDLNQAFPSSMWSFRLNQAASSLVVVCKADAQPQPQSDLSQLVWLRVRAQLSLQGIDVPEIPLSPTEIVEPTTVERLRLRWFSSPARWVVNGLSLSLSLSALLTSLAIFVIGFVGLFLPLSPGFWLLMLASFIFDLAINLRRPFVEVA